MQRLPANVGGLGGAIFGVPVVLARQRVDGDQTAESAKRVQQDRRRKSARRTNDEHATGVITTRY